MRKYIIQKVQFRFSKNCLNRNVCTVHECLILRFYCDWIIAFVVFKNMGFYADYNFKMMQTKFQTQRLKGEQQNRWKVQLTPSHREQFFNQLNFCRPFPKSARPTLEVAVVILGLLHLLIVFVAFMILTDSSSFYGLDLISFQNTLQLNYLYLILAVSFVLKLVIATLISLEHHFDCKKDKQRILCQFIQSLRQYQRVTIELDLALSAILLLSTSPISFINFIGSVAIITFSLIFLENYCVKKDVFYIGSVKLYLLLRLATVVGSITTYFCLAFANNPVSLYIFLIVHSAMAFLITSNYFDKGYMIYRARLPKWGLILQIISLNSMLINMWIRLQFENGHEVIIIPTLLTMVLVGLFFNLKLNKAAVSILNCDDIELESNYLLQLLQQSHYSIEDMTLLMGTIFLHERVGCPNPKCYTNNPSLYDSKTKQDCHTHLYHQNRASILKFYLQCRYETHLERSPKDFKAMLLYCEFLYNDFNNLGLCLHWIKRLNSNRTHLSLFIKIKLNGLIAKIKQANSYFIGQVYTNNLQIEGLIQAEKEHDYITAETETILFQQANVWQMLEDQNMDLSLLRQHSEQIFDRIESNSKRWKGISNYVQQSDRWRSQYLFFAMFIKNERLKNKVVESLTLSGVGEGEKQGYRVISNLDLFDRNSCCLHTQIHNGEILIKKVSNHFHDVTGYEPNEVVMSTLNMIIPKMIAKTHHEMVLQMSGNGKFYNEKAYTTNKVYILNKEGFIIPALKMYKEFVTVEGNLDYVCFLKKTNQKQCVILCDSQFEVQGVAKEAVDCIAGDWPGGKFIRCVNLISLIPGLVCLSKFKNSLTGKKAQLSDAVKEDSCCSTSLKSSKMVQGRYQLIYPQQKLQEYAISYQSHIRELDQCDTEKHYEAIQKLSANIMQAGHQTIGCELILNQIRNHSMHYYQIKLKRLSSNKLNTFNSSSFIASPRSVALELPGGDKKRGITVQSANIFIKEESNQAPECNSYLAYSKTVWLLFFTVFSLVYMVRVALMYSSFAKMSRYITNQDSTVRASILSSRLANEYQLQLMNTTLERGDPFIQIQELTEELKVVINSDTMKEVIFDKSINTPALYSPRSFSQDKFDEIDFFYVMQGLMQTLADQDESMDRSSLRRMQETFIEYQFPSLTNCLNHTRNQIASSFVEQEAAMQADYTAFFIVEALVLFSSLAIISANAYKFFGSMIEMLKIHCYFSPKDINKIRTYVGNIFNVFKDMHQAQAAPARQQLLIQRCQTSQLRRHASSTSKPISHRQSQQSNNLNKKSKNIRMGRQLKVGRFFHFVRIILTFAAITILTALLNIHLHSLLTPIKHLKEAQLAHYQWIPTHYLTAQIISHAYTLPTFTPHTYTYQLLFSNLQILQRMIYTPNPQFDNPIYNQIKQFYHGNFCHTFNTLTESDITVEQCLSSADSSFENGIRQYSYYQYLIVGKIIKEGFIPDLDLVSSYFRSIQIFHVLNVHFIDRLNEQYTRLTKETLLQVKIFAISMAIFILAIMAFVIIAICSFLEKEYQFYSNFYASMMPQYVISEQKVIKSKLGVIKFL